MISEWIARQRSRCLTLLVLGGSLGCGHPSVPGMDASPDAEAPSKPDGGCSDDMECPPGLVCEFSARRTHSATTAADGASPPVGCCDPTIPEACNGFTK
jgi:hypothetical protein